MLASTAAGIDAGKFTLDLHLLPANQRLRVANDPQGRQRLTHLLADAAPIASSSEPPAAMRRHWCMR